MDNTRSTRTSRRVHSSGGRVQNSEDGGLLKNTESVQAKEVSDKGAAPERIAKLRPDAKDLDEYDPTKDGERASSSGSSTEARQDLSTEIRKP